MPVYQLYREQKIPEDVQRIWDFIATPSNLQNITPEYMGFDITTSNLPDKMYPGMIIAYKVSPFPGIKMNWVTEITHIKEQEYFVDEQRSGPYKIWHHEHKIRPVDGGVLMTDLVTYQPPLGILGTVANRFFIQKKLDEIFEFRRQKLTEIFGQIEQGNSDYTESI
ncbi:MAG: SRPBCC family protein [Bacteroidales bacterium]